MRHVSNINDREQWTPPLVLQAHFPSRWRLNQRGPPAYIPCCQLQRRLVYHQWWTSCHATRHHWMSSAPAYYTQYWVFLLSTPIVIVGLNWVYLLYICYWDGHWRAQGICHCACDTTKYCNPRCACAPRVNYSTQENWHMYLYTSSTENWPQSSIFLPQSPPWSRSSPYNPTDIAQYIAHTAAAAYP